MPAEDDGGGELDAGGVGRSGVLDESVELQATIHTVRGGALTCEVLLRVSLPEHRPIC